MRSAVENTLGDNPGDKRKARRGHGEGGIRFDPIQNSWEATVEAGVDPVTGKRVRFKIRAKTKTQALARMREAREKVDRNVKPGAGAITVGRFLDEWLKTVVDGRVASDNTRVNYEGIVRVHIKPALGSTRLDKLTADQVDRFLARKAAAGLSRSHVGRMRTILADAIRHAERRGLVARNAAALSVMPKTAPPAVRRSLQPEEARRLLAAAQWRGDGGTGERLEALIVVGLVVGLRPGELLGLLWRDIDLEGDPATLTVSGSLKREPRSDSKGYDLSLGDVKRSTAGRRTVALPPVAVDALRAHRARQEVERGDAGDMWVDSGLVFCSEVGSPLDPSNVRRTFKRVSARAGIEGVFPYMLRHTAASLLVDAGAGIEEVADLLGDDPRTLLRHYRHKVRPVAGAGLAMQDVLAGD